MEEGPPCFWNFKTGGRGVIYFGLLFVVTCGDPVRRARLVPNYPPVGERGPGSGGGVMPFCRENSKKRKIRGLPLDTEINLYYTVIRGDGNESNRNRKSNYEGKGNDQW